MSQEQNVTETPVLINGWDSVIIQINDGETGCGAIRMMKQDIDAMMELHGTDRGYILEMMLKAVESTPKENFEQKK